MGDSICYFLLIVTGKARTCTPIQGCDARINGSCYAHVDDNLNWNEAEECCVAWGGHLASIHSDDENILLNDIRNQDRFTWIGLSDTANDGVYLWTDGTPYDYDNFHPNQSDGRQGGNGDYLFMFSERMNGPVGICISHNKVFVTQLSGHCINMYELEGKLIKSVGSRGNRRAQFNYPLGLDVSDRNNNIYVCDYYNHRIKILTEELKYHSMLGIDLLKYPLDVKVTRDRVLVLDVSDLCMFVFNSDHVLTNRLITRGVGKQTNNPCCFDIDREYNIIMSDYPNHCVYVFNQDGEQIHKFGKEGQGIGEFYKPFGIALDNTGHIIVVCEKNTNCLQFF